MTSESYLWKCDFLCFFFWCVNFDLHVSRGENHWHQQRQNRLTIGQFLCFMDDSSSEENVMWPSTVEQSADHRLLFVPRFPSHRGHCHNRCQQRQLRSGHIRKIHRRHYRRLVSSFVLKNPTFITNISIYKCLLLLFLCFTTRGQPCSLY